MKRKIHPKVKNFVWRMDKGWLPTTSELIMRGMNVDKRCFRCCYPVESIFHTIWSCPAMCGYWKMSKYFKILHPVDENDVVGKLVRMRDCLNC